MRITGQVMNASSEKREMVGKDGNKRTTNISHVLMSVGKIGEDFEIVNVRAYDASFALPQVGKEWTTPRVKKYENFDGQVGDAIVAS